MLSTPLIWNSHHIDTFFILSGYIVISPNTIVLHTDCSFGVTGAGQALNNNLMSRKHMCCLLNCWGTEPNLTNKTVFPTLALSRKYIRRWRRHDKIYSFSPGWQTQNQKQGAHNFFVVNCKGKTNTHEQFTLVGQKHLVRQKEEKQIALLCTRDMTRCGCQMAITDSHRV